MAWGVCNEPRARNNVTAYRAWINDTARLIKSLDSRHLVTTGSEGETPWPADNGLNPVIDHTSTDIDFMTFHVWPQNWGRVSFDRDGKLQGYETASQKVHNYIKTHMEYGRRINKPVVLEEFGFPRDTGSLEPDARTLARNKFFRSVFSDVVGAMEERAPIAGVMPWAWSGSTKPTKAGDIWYPGNAFTGDPPHEFQGWYSIYSELDPFSVAYIKAYSRAISKVSASAVKTRASASGTPILSPSVERFHKENYEDADVEVKALLVDPAKTGVYFSLPTYTMNRSGMLREKINAYRIVDGQKVWDEGTPDTMRGDLLTFDGHKLKFEEDPRNHDKEVVAISSYGNLIMNDWIAAYTDGEVIRRDDEPPGRIYPSIVIFKDRRIEFKRIKYDFKDSRVTDIISRKDITDSIEQAVSGQPIVEDGKPVNPADISEQYYDLRPLLHLPFLGEAGRTIHFALD